MEFYHNVIDLSQPVLTTGSPKAVHVLSRLCDDTCKRSLAIRRKSRVLCPVSRLASVHIWRACAEQGRLYDSNKQTNNQIYWTQLFKIDIALYFGQFPNQVVNTYAKLQRYVRHTVHIHIEYLYTYISSGALTRNAEQWIETQLFTMYWKEFM